MPSSKSAAKREAEYRAEDDHRTLTRAAEIHGDAARMAGVQRHHTKQQKALHKVGGMIAGHAMAKGRR
jgi:hypothetical protein